MLASALTRATDVEAAASFPPYMVLFTSSSILFVALRLRSLALTAAQATSVERRRPAAVLLAHSDRPVMP